MLYIALVLHIIAHIAYNLYGKSLPKQENCMQLVKYTALNSISKETGTKIAGVLCVLYV